MSPKKIVPILNGMRHRLNASEKLHTNDELDSTVLERAGVDSLHECPVNNNRNNTERIHNPVSRKIHKAVSVVVPTCGRADLLNRCLGALTRQELQAVRYEIIVVDDGPHPDTRKLVEQWARSMSNKNLDVIYIANNGPHGPAAARNRGWRAARASIIAFTDDDTVPTPGWLSNGLSLFDETVHVICGRIEMPLSDRPTDYERDARHLETAEFVTANCFCRKEVLEFINGFDERFRFAWREDSDLHFRLLGLQANILYAPQAVVIHPVRPAPWGVSISQQKKVLFDALLYKKHPVLYRQKIRAKPRWDYYMIVAMLLMTLIGLIFQQNVFALVCGALWAGMTMQFSLMRLRGTTKAFSHIAEMIITSILIPPHAVFWRMTGALKFRVLFV
ncbi:MAG: glycosyltransferase family 2 protein [Burkholderiaceae bacterium]